MTQNFVDPDLNKKIYSLDPNLLRGTELCGQLPKILVDTHGFWGEKYEVDINDHIGFWLYMRGFFDLIPSFISVILAEQTKKTTWVDVGANIGATLLPQAVKAGIRVIAIEANAQTCSSLLKNISLNEDIGVTTISALAGFNTNKIVKLFVPDVNTGMGSIYQNWGTKTTKYSTISSCEYSLNCLLNGLVEKDKINCIKLDIEGSEANAIRGSSELFNEAYSPPLLIEWLPDEVNKQKQSLRNLLPVLQKYYAYAMSLKSRVTYQSGKIYGSIEAISFNPDTKCSNVLFLPRGNQSANVTKILNKGATFQILNN